MNSPTTAVGTSQLFRYVSISHVVYEHIWESLEADNKQHSSYSLFNIYSQAKKDLSIPGRTFKLYLRNVNMKNSVLY
jgi:hypothetical protein